MADSEGLPKSLIEAAASGLPIVTTDTIGCREVVENGFFVPIKTVESLAKALMKLIENETLRQTMGEKAAKEQSKNLPMNWSLSKR